MKKLPLSLLPTFVAVGALYATAGGGLVARSHAADGQTAAVSVAPTGLPQTPKGLARLQANGVRLTHLGGELGLDGYMAQSADNHLQSIYVTPGGGIVAGVMFDADGRNITAMQIARMQQRIEAAQVEAQAAQKQASAMGAGLGLAPGQDLQAVSSATPSVPEPPPQDRSPSAQDTLSGHGLNQFQASPVPPAPAQQAPAQVDPTSLLARSRSFISSYDKNTFLNDAEHTGYFSFDSKVPGVPTVIMVADPKCHYCHNTWPVLRQLALDNKINIRIILASVLSGQGSEEAVDALLSNPDVDRVWNEGQGSSDDKPIMEVVSRGSQQWQRADAIRQQNTSFALRYIKRGTPLLAYVGRDGQLRTAEGPNDLAGFLGDI